MISIRSDNIKLQDMNVSFPLSVVCFFHFGEVDTKEHKNSKSVELNDVNRLFTTRASSVYIRRHSSNLDVNILRIYFVLR